MFTSNLLGNKRILITGGGTGLGKGMAERFLELGATVHICGRREEVLEQTAAELTAKGPIHPIPCDVRNLDAVEAMIDSIWSEGSSRHSRQQRGRQFHFPHRRPFPAGVGIGHQHRSNGNAPLHHGLRTSLA